MTGAAQMEELRDILEQTILFYEKYDWVDSPLGNETNNEFWSLEEMHTAFTMDKIQYVVYQVWSKNLFNCHHHITIYKDNQETDLDIFFIRTLLANINREIGA